MTATAAVAVASDASAEPWLSCSALESQRQASIARRVRGAVESHFMRADTHEEGETTNTNATNTNANDANATANDAEADAAPLTPPRAAAHALPFSPLPPTPLPQQW
eukprot:1662480-Pleurochrysis_carterae.AAC.1